MRAPCSGDETRETISVRWNGLGFFRSHDLRRAGESARNDRDRRGSAALGLPPAAEPIRAHRGRGLLHPHARGPLYPGEAGGEKARPLARGRCTQTGAPDLLRPHRSAASAGAGRGLRAGTRPRFQIGSRLAGGSITGQPAIRGALGAALARRRTLRRQRRAGERQRPSHGLAFP